MINLRLSRSHSSNPFPELVARHPSTSRFAVPPPEPKGFPAGSDEANHSGRLRPSNSSNSAAMRGGKVRRYWMGNSVEGILNPDMDNKARPGCCVFGQKL